VWCVTCPCWTLDASRLSLIVLVGPQRAVDAAALPREWLAGTEVARRTCRRFVRRREASSAAGAASELSGGGRQESRGTVLAALLTGRQLRRTSGAGVTARRGGRITELTAGTGSALGQSNDRGEGAWCAVRARWLPGEALRCAEVTARAVERVVERSERLRKWTHTSCDRMSNRLQATLTHLLLLCLTHACRTESAGAEACDPGVLSSRTRETQLGRIRRRVFLHKTHNDEERRT
jgi:hypothetical protein